MELFYENSPLFRRLYDSAEMESSFDKVEVLFALCDLIVAGKVDLSIRYDGELMVSETLPN